MDNNIFNEIGTTLDLNGPILSYIEQPTGSTGIGTTVGATSGGASISFTGIATGVDPGTGYLSYQWYEVDVGELSDSTYITGTASTGPVGTAATLTISNLITPTDNQRKFYVVADYVASAYQQDQLGIAKSTGNAWNEPLTSGIGTATVTPLIEIVAQPPEGRQALINESGSISVNADLTDSYFADDLQYQWYLNGELVVDGTKTVVTTTTSSVPGLVDNTYTTPAAHALPAVGIENLEITLAGGSGGNGGRENLFGGGPGRKGRAARFTLPNSLKGELLTFGVGRRGNDGTTGGPNAGGAGGVLDSDDITTVDSDLVVSFTITQATSGNSANENSVFVFDDSGCAGSPGTYMLTALSGTHTRDVPSGYEDNSLCTHFTMGNGLNGIGHVRTRNSGKTLDWIKPSNISIINDTPTLSVTVNRGTFSFEDNAAGTFNANQWYNYTYGQASGSSVKRIKWNYGAPTTTTVSLDDDGDGGRGGGGGLGGHSGGGGGGGAATYVKNPDGKIIVAGGGGAGGGASNQRHGWEGHAAGKTFSTVSGAVPASDGNDGATERGGSSSGGGGGGGGGGSPGGGGGGSGQDRVFGGFGGDGGSSRYDVDIATLVSQWTSNGDGYANIKYTGYTDGTVTTTTNTTLSGTTSNTLTIGCDTVGVQTCQCKITSETASNSPIWTDVVNFVTTSVADQYNVIVEAIGISDTATLSSINLSNGDYEFNTTQSEASTGSIISYYSFYAPFRDISVEMDFYGGRGNDNGSYTGGEGGYSRIRFDMDHNVEYVLVGLSSAINAPFLYRKAELMACVGGGGNAGGGGHGGDGGGVGVSGENGQGRGAGEGGPTFATGTLPQNGVFGSAFTPTLVYPGDSVATGFAAGRVLPCTKGVFWAQQGNAACADISNETTFRLPDGTIVTNTANIARGFKAGYNIMQTAGNGNGGDGGNGCHGGKGSSSGNAGGGGGSGYDGGDIIVVDTQRAGSTGDAKVILRVVT